MCTKPDASEPCWKQLHYKVIYYLTYNLGYRVGVAVKHFSLTAVGLKDGEQSVA